MKRACITLLTDFGLCDSYVGQMKGVISGINPTANIIDITHAISPQDVRQAAFAIADAVDAFPEGSIHICVVDPGVGTSRRAIAAEIGLHKFVCPDNGLLTIVLREKVLKRFVVLDRSDLWRTPVSRTFHGRDVFAPVAAAWSLGCDLSELGSPDAAPLIELNLPALHLGVDAQGSNFATGVVIAIDEFGNVITDISRIDLPEEAANIEIVAGETRISQIVSCYGDACVGDVIALFGSSDRLELAVVNGSAALHLGIEVHDSVTVRWKEHHR